MDYSEVVELIDSLSSHKIIHVLGLDEAIRIVLLKQIGRKRFFTGDESVEFFKLGRILQAFTKTKYKFTAQAEIES